MTSFKAFISGFLATIFFHQGLFFLFYLGGILPVRPFNTEAVGFLEIPQFLSLAFWGGVWGVVLIHFVKYKISNRNKAWIQSTLWGAIGPTLIAMLVVFPLKGRAVSGLIILMGLLLNAAWGFGCYFFMSFLESRKKRLQ